MQLLVDDRHRDDQRIGARRRVEGVDDVAQNPVHRRSQLSGPGPPTLDRPAQIAAIADELADIETQRQPVDREVRGRPPDKDDTGAAGDGPDRKEIQVRPTHRERRLDTVCGERNRQGEPVQIGPVRHQEQQRVLAAQRPHPPSLFLVDLNVVRPVQPAAEAIPYLVDPRRVRRRHLPQVSGSLGLDARHVPVQLSCESLESLVEGIVGEQLAHLRCIGGKTRRRLVDDADALQDPPGADPVEGARHCGLLDGFGVHLPPRR